MPSGPDPEAVRAAAIAWLAEVTMDGELDVTREQLASDFLVGGVRFPLVDRGRGIRKPVGWDAALSITTSAPGGGRTPRYDDPVGPDGLHRYEFRRDRAGAAENQGLRTAMQRSLPLIWFVGVRPGVFLARFPVYLVAEELEASRFVVAVTEEERSFVPGSVVEDALRRYLVTQTRRRLHQRLFASQVMSAYGTRCAVCSLGHRRLLDAAHIRPDAAAGAPVVSNGLALCKIHHAAFDVHVLGIRPDLVVEIKQALLEEIDGPMLRHGLQEHHGRPLLQVPRRPVDRPDRRALAERYALFSSA